MQKTTFTYRTLHQSFRYIVTICLCNTTILFSSAQSPSPDDMRFGKITTEQGLSHSTVSRICQDTKGFMWFGGYDGVNRFDGKNIRVFQHNKSDTTSLSNNTIWSLYGAKDGSVWIGTVNGLNRYSYETDAFERFYLGQNIETIAVCNYLFEDQGNNIWVSTAGNGLFKISTLGIDKNGTIQWKIKHYIHDASKNSLPHDYVSCIAQHPKYPHTLWLSTRAGLARMDTQREVFTNYKQPLNKLNTADKNTLNNITFDKSGLLWYGTNNTGIGYFNPEIEQWLDSSELFSNSENTLRTNVADLLYDKRGGIWGSSFGGGIRYIENPKNASIQYIQHHPLNPKGLSSNNIVPLYEDKDGVIWIGTNGTGCNYYDPNNQSFYHYKSNRFTGSNISFIAEDSTHQLWVATNSEGLNKVVFNEDKTIREVQQFDFNPNKNSIKSNNIRSLMMYDNDLILIGQVFSGVSIYDENKQNFRDYLYQKNDLQALDELTPYAFLKDQQKNIWIGTFAGVYKYNTSLKAIEPLQAESNKLAILENSSSNFILEEEGILFIGTNKEGLFRYNTNTKELTPYKIEKGNDKSLQSNVILCGYQSTNGHIWIGTWDGGLSRFDPKTNMFKTFLKKDGLPNNTVYSIQEDDQNNLWLSTNKGLSKFDLQDSIFYNFDIKNGLQGDEFNSRAGLKTTDGRLFFGGVNGMNAFYPDEIVSDTTAPPIYITRLVKQQTQDGKDIVVDIKGIVEKKKITLTHHDRVLSFEAAAIELTQPHQLKYAYRLRGFSDNWIELGDQAKFDITNLDQGTYTLEVKVSSNNNSWLPQITDLQITMLPAWWETWWAYLIYVFLIGLGFYGIYQYRLSQLLKDQQMRTKISSDLHDDVGTILSALAMQSEIMSFTAKSEDVSKFQKLSEMSRRAMGNMRDTVWAIDARKDNIESLVERMQDYLFDLFDNHRMSYVFDKSIQHKNLKLPPDIRRNFYLIFKEALNNASKYSNGDQVKIQFSQQGKKLKLSIQDNGIVDESKVKKSGLGLSNMQMRADSIQASYSLEMGDGVSINVQKEL